MCLFVSWTVFKTKSANNDWIEPQPEETKSGSRGGGTDLNIILRRSERDRRHTKYLEDCESWFNEYSNDVKKGPKGGLVS